MDNDEDRVIRTIASFACWDGSTLLTLRQVCTQWYHSLCEEENDELWHDAAFHKYGVDSRELPEGISGYKAVTNWVTGRYNTMFKEVEYTHKPTHLCVSEHRIWVITSYLKLVQYDTHTIQVTGDVTLPRPAGMVHGFDMQFFVSFPLEGTQETPLMVISKEASVYLPSLPGRAVAMSDLNGDLLVLTSAGSIAIYGEEDRQKVITVPMPETFVCFGCFNIWCSTAAVIDGNRNLTVYELDRIPNTFELNHLWNTQLPLEAMVSKVKMCSSTRVLVSYQFGLTIYENGVITRSLQGVTASFTTTLNAFVVDVSSRQCGGLNVIPLAGDLPPVSFENKCAVKAPQILVETSGCTAVGVDTSGCITKWVVLEKAMYDSYDERQPKYTLPMPCYICGTAITSISCNKPCPHCLMVTGCDNHPNDAKAGETHTDEICGMWKLHRLAIEALQGNAVSVVESPITWNGWGEYYASGVVGLEEDVEDCPQDLLFVVEQVAVSHALSGVLTLAVALQTVLQSGKLLKQHSTLRIIVEFCDCLIAYPLQNVLEPAAIIFSSVLSSAGFDRIAFHHESFPPLISTYEGFTVELVPALHSSYDVHWVQNLGVNSDDRPLLKAGLVVATCPYRPPLYSLQGVSLLAVCPTPYPDGLPCILSAASGNVVSIDYSNAFLMIGERDTVGIVV